MKDFRPSSPGNFYCASAIGFVPVAAGATDLFQVYGSNTKLIKVYQVIVSGFAGTGVTVPVSILTRSTLNTSGTLSVASTGQFDLTSPPTTATNITAYITGNPTLGTTQSTIAQQYVTLGATTLAEQASTISFDFGDIACPVILRGLNNGLVVNFNTTAITTGKVGITVIWSEE